MIGFDFLDILIVAIGLYLAYVGIDMKRSGVLKSNSMVSKNVDLNKAKDMQGYIQYMYKKMIAFGILIAVAGGADYYNETQLHLPYVAISICGVYLVLVIIYAVVSMKAQRKYLDPNAGRKKN